MSSKAVPLRQVLLEFTASTLVEDGKKPRNFRDSLSALELTDEGRTLFAGVDETVNAAPTIERLSLVNGGYAAHEPFALDDFLDLPDPSPKKGRVDEVDIEGLAVDGSYLWVVGSHSCNRKKPKKRDPAESIQRLSTV